MLYKILTLLTQPEAGILGASQDKAQKLIEGLRLSITADSLQNKRFALSVDSSENTTKFLSILPVSSSFLSEPDTLSGSAKELLNVTTEASSFFGMLLLWLCSVHSEQSLGLSVLADFLEWNTAALSREADIDFPQKQKLALQFVTGLLICYPALLKVQQSELAAAAMEPAAPIAYTQYQIQNNSHIFTAQFAAVSLQTLSGQVKSQFSPLLEWILSDTNIGLPDLLKKVVDETFPLGTYSEAEPVVLTLPEKAWDICTGLCLSTFLLGPEWTYENVYRTVVFSLFSGSERSSNARLAAISYIGVLLKCFAEHYPPREEKPQKMYMEYVGKLLFSVKEQNLLLTLKDKCWACYWLLKVNKMGRDDLLILKEWFNELSEEQKKLLPEGVHRCLSDIKID